MLREVKIQKTKFQMTVFCSKKDLPQTSPRNAEGHLGKSAGDSLKPAYLVAHRVGCEHLSIVVGDLLRVCIDTHQEVQRRDINGTGA